MSRANKRNRQARDTLDSMNDAIAREIEKKLWADPENLREGRRAERVNVMDADKQVVSSAPKSVTTTPPVKNTC